MRPHQGVVKTVRPFSSCTMTEKKRFVSSDGASLGYCFVGIVFTKVLAESRGNGERGRLRVRGYMRAKSRGNGWGKPRVRSYVRAESRGNGGGRPWVRGYMHAESRGNGTAEGARLRACRVAWEWEGTAEGARQRACRVPGKWGRDGLGCTATCGPSRV